MSGSGSLPPPDGDPRWRSARRAVLHRVLALVAAADCGDSLVLRGSMAMTGWFGDRARDPGDLDFVVRPVAVVPLDDRSPYPYVERLDSVQVDPEIAHGAGRNEFWGFEEFETGGLRPVTPPEGLHWVAAEELAGVERPHERVLELIENSPRFGNLTLDVENARNEANWSYEEYSGSGGGGARLIIPWYAPDSMGQIQLDFAYDQPLAEPPALMAIPHAGGATPIVTWAATPALSLAWKLHWLAADQEAHGVSQGKDVYDAVLLSEMDGVRLSPRLRHEVGVLPATAEIRRWRTDWDGAQPWLDRLAAAVERLYHT
jgi:Nucleotidyl transferase AbiEii toxin, Type IV TA system